VESRRGKLLGEYHICHRAHEWDAWNYEKSKGHWAEGMTSGSKVLLYFHDAVLDVNKVPAFDVFFTVTQKWITSDGVREAIAARRLTGFAFYPISAS
jgi:hypothetical protein